jgi:hypothetical protein
MRIFSILIVPIFLLLLTSGLSAQRPRAPVKPKTVRTLNETPVPAGTKDPTLTAIGVADADGWKTYQAKPDDLRVAFPGTPVAIYEKGTSPTDPGMTKYYVPEAIQPAGQSLSLFVIPIDTPIDDPDKVRAFYTAWLKSALEAAKGEAAPKLLQDKEFAIGNRAGLDVVMEQGDTRWYTRAFLVGDKFYQMMVSSAKPGVADVELEATVRKSAQKFLSSLRVAEPPKAAPRPADPIYGKFENNTYSNAPIGFSLQPPAGWSVADITPSAERRAAVREMLQSDDKELNESIDRSIDVEKIIFKLSRKPAGSPANAMFSVSAGKYPPGSGSLDANTLATRNAFENSGMNSKIEPTRSKVFGRVKANILDMRSMIGETEVRQRVYLFANRGYALSIVFSYIDEIDLLAMEQAMATLKFY